MATRVAAAVPVAEQGHGLPPGHAVDLAPKGHNRRVVPVGPLRNTALACLYWVTGTSEDVLMVRSADPNHMSDPTDEEVFRPMYPGLRRFAAVVAPLDVEPEDLLQDALVATLGRHRLTDLDDPAAYLRQAMLNLVSNFRRRSISRWKALRRLAASPPEAKETYPSDLSDLNWLSPMQRAVLYLSEVEGYRFGEIAQMVGCSEPAARMSASRARRRLRQALAGEV